MAIPVKFYSVTAEEYEEIRKKLVEEAEQNKGEPDPSTKELEGGIFFVDGTNEIHKGV